MMKTASGNGPAVPRKSPPPATPQNKKAHRKMPTMDKNKKLLAILAKEPERRAALHASISARQVFLEKQTVGNHLNEMRRLHGQLIEHRIPQLQDHQLAQRRMGYLGHQVVIRHPIIGPTGANQHF